MIRCQPIGLRVVSEGMELERVINGAKGLESGWGQCVVRMW